MATQPLSDAQCQEAVDAVEQHGGCVQAARALDMPAGTFRNRWAEGKRRGLRPGGGRPSQTAQEDAEAIPQPFGYEEAQRAWARAIGQIESRYAGPCTRRAAGEWRKVLVVSDIHAPFHDPDALAYVFAHDGDADLCIINGDIGDQYAFSRFVKYDNVSYEQELGAVTHILERFSEQYPDVLVVQGNHDARVEKQLRDRLPPDLMAVVYQLTNGVLDPTKAAASKLPNVRFDGHQTASGATIMWMVKVGDALVMHAEKFSRVPGAALRAIEDWASDYEHHMAIEGWRLCVQAHTHQLSWVPFRAGKLLVEQGCLAKMMGYQMGPRLGGRPQRQGYVTFYQHRETGRTDLNSVRLVWIDEAVSRVA